MEAALRRERDRPSAAAVWRPRAIGTGADLPIGELATAPLRSLPRPGLLERPLTDLRGAGPKLAEAAAELEISSLGDMLRHLPRDYRDRAAPLGLSALRLGEEATVEVEVARPARLRPTRRRGLSMVEAEVSDPSGTVKAVWFNRAWLAEKLQPGVRLLMRGKLEKRGFTVSEQELLGNARSGSAESPPPGLHTTGLVAWHPASERLRPQRLREWAWQVAPRARHAVEPLPAGLRSELELPGAAESLLASHFPPDLERARQARRRLAFEELFLYQAALAVRRERRVAAGRAPALSEGGEPVERWISGLPFELTSDQRTAIDEVAADLARPQPMQRLLMGEVGSGKTVVALAAMLRALAAGSQAALMAPTETLAEQHLRTLRALLGAEARVPGHGLLAEVAPEVTLLTSSTGRAERRALSAALAAGEPRIVVGTHALIEDSVEFASLAVAVVDEQHRFGVRQRAALDAKGPGELIPHLLHMTATPIPRTLSLTAYGDLDTTALHELPAGRKPVRTWVVEEDRRKGAYEFIRERLREGRQAFVVCPRVSEAGDDPGGVRAGADGSQARRAAADRSQARAAEAEARRLASGEFRDFEVELLHGQMGADAKAAAMERFASGAAQVLVATTVIEVGIDVPNATVMLIEGAERFGLSQLHQLRGRVGRAEHESFCICFGDPDSEAARERLRAIATESDGFRLAEIDLSIRGEGEILGTRQHGLPRFRAASLPEDAGLLLEARRRLLELIRAEGSVEAPALDLVIGEARRRFGDERLDPIAA